MNGYFVEAVIFTDDKTSLGHTRSSILATLSVCCVYARNMDILKIWIFLICVFYPAHPNLLPGLTLHRMNTDIVFVPSCIFLTISVFNHDLSDRNIPQFVEYWYRRSNEVMSD